MTSLSLGFGPEAIISYQRLAYTPWHALAEFVDNATQSFIDHKTDIFDAFAKKLGGDAGPPTVTITYDRLADVITISDNALGMDYVDLQRALKIAQPPPRPHGRSQYGLGMKTAACWLGDYWEVRTKKLDATEEFFFRVDVDQIRKGNFDLHLETTPNKDPGEHYTKIVITRLHRRFAGRTPKKIQDFLASMYRYDIKDYGLKLVWQKQELQFKWLTQFMKYDTGVYKKDFEFEVTADDGKKKRVYGWVGILGGDERGRSNAGFVVLRHKRALKAHPDEWRPEFIFGDARNDLINQRITGEINLDDFEVSHTKDGIQWQGDEEEQVEAALGNELALYIAKAKEPVSAQVSSDSARSRDEEVRIAMDVLREQLASDALQRALSVPPRAPLLVELAGAPLVAASRVPRMATKIAIGEVAFYIANDASPKDPYVAHIIAADALKVFLNARHSYWGKLDPFTLPEFIRVCAYDALAEWRCKQAGIDALPATIRSVKDSILRHAP